MSNSLKTERIDHALIVKFVRPEIRNPLSVCVLEEIDFVLGELGDASRLIFTGTDGVFASGADLREINDLSESEAAAFARRGQELFARISDLPTMTIAAISGPCFGGALDLALACDRRIGALNSTFCHPGAGLGIITGWGGTQRLPRLIGQTNAMRMFLTAAPINSEEALRVRLIDKIAADPLAEAVNS